MQRGFYDICNKKGYIRKFKNTRGILRTLKSIEVFCDELGVILVNFQWKYKILNLSLRRSRRIFSRHALFEVPLPLLILDLWNTSKLLTSKESHLFLTMNLYFHWNHCYYLDGTKLHLFLELGFSWSSIAGVKELLSTLSKQIQNLITNGNLKTLLSLLVNLLLQQINNSAIHILQLLMDNLVVDTLSLYKFTWIKYSCNYLVPKYVKH